jgi:cation transport ATPase
MTAIIISALCALALAITTAFLLYQGRFGRRGIIWVKED